MGPPWPLGKTGEEMFFSLGKLIWLALILWGVWVIFRVIEKRRQTKDSNQQGRSDNPGPELELSECDQCGAFASQTGCSKPGCPLRR